MIGMYPPTFMGRYWILIRVDFTDYRLFFPCFNEEANINQVITKRLRWPHESRQTSKLLSRDDGSRDQTRILWLVRAKTEPRVRLVRHFDE